MLDPLKTLLTNQYEAALCTLSACMKQCPDDGWGMRVAKYKFGQVVFHTLFYADFYLGADESAFKTQPFHREHAATFADYEELADHPPVTLHERTFVAKYLAHCRQKAVAVVAAETVESLSARAGFARREFSRAELHVYNIRHIQHHAAQLVLRLRRNGNKDLPWIGSGWREL